METHLFHKWKDAIGKHQEFRNITFVCSLHFDASSMVEMNGKLFLKHGTVPSVFINHHHPQWYAAQYLDSR